MSKQHTVTFKPSEGKQIRSNDNGTIFLDTCVPNPKAGQQHNGKKEGNFLSIKDAVEMAFITNPQPDKEGNTKNGMIKVSLKPGVSISGDIFFFVGETKEKAS